MLKQEVLDWGLVTQINTGAFCIVIVVVNENAETYNRERLVSPVKP